MVAESDNQKNFFLAEKNFVKKNFLTAEIVHMNDFGSYFFSGAKNFYHWKNFHSKKN